MEKFLTSFKDWFTTYQPDGTLLERCLWGFWAVWLLLVFAAVWRVIRFRLGLVREKSLWGDGSGIQRPAAVIVPIKGVSPSHTSAFFQSLLEQDYSRYRLIVAVETSDDPAAEWLHSQFGVSLSNPEWTAEDSERGFQNLRLVVAGRAKGQGQKVHNQLAAFEELTAEDEIIVFVDADIVCPTDWLAKLTAPINRGTHDPSTTYRWLIPKRSTFINQMASVINASVTTQGGHVRDNMPWGGSMAISRPAFLDLDVPQLFAGSLNDDLRLGKAAKKAGYKVGYVRNLVRPTQVDFTLKSFFEFARRQYLQVKFFAPILYFGGNLILAVYFWGFVSIVAAIAMGHLWAWLPLIVATLLDQIRATTRESIYRHLFGHDKSIYRPIARTGWLEHFLTPVYMALHGLIVFSTWFMNKVEWGGVRYQVEGVNRTRVLGHKPADRFSISGLEDLALPAGTLASAGLASSALGEEISGSSTTTASPKSGFEDEDQTVTIWDDGESDGDVEVDEEIEATVTEPDDGGEPETIVEPDESVAPTEPITPIARPVRRRPRKAADPAVPVGASQFTIFDLEADRKARRAPSFESPDTVSSLPEADAEPVPGEEADLPIPSLGESTSFPRLKRRKTPKSPPGSVNPNLPVGASEFVAPPFAEPMEEEKPADPPPPEALPEVTRHEPVPDPVPDPVLDPPDPVPLPRPITSKKSAASATALGPNSPFFVRTIGGETRWLTPFLLRQIRENDSRKDYGNVNPMALSHTRIRRLSRAELRKIIWKLR